MRSIADITFKTLRRIVAVSKDRTVYSEHAKESEGLPRGISRSAGPASLSGLALHKSRPGQLRCAGSALSNMEVDHSSRKCPARRPPFPALST